MYAVGTRIVTITVCWLNGFAGAKKSLLNFFAVCGRGAIIYAQVCLLTCLQSSKRKTLETHHTVGAWIRYDLVCVPCCLRNDPT